MTRAHAIRPKPIPAAMADPPASVPEADVRRGASRVVLLCVLVVLTFYARSAWSYGKVLDPTPTSVSFQNRIADALVAGQLNLRIDPPKGLLALRDPYDPAANIQYRAQGLHDLSLYKGKLYAYFGPAPAILLYVPFRLLRVGRLSSTLACLIFCSIGFLFSLALFRLLVRWCCGSVPVLVDCVAVFTLGLGVPAAWIVYIGRDYEASIACGYMLLFGGLYFLARGALDGWRAPSFALGSGLLASAVAARPSMIPAGIFVIVTGAGVLAVGLQPARRIRCLVALIAPYALVGLALAWYNFARFNSIFEFGSSYQMAGINPKTYPYGRLSYIPKGYWAYLLSPARLLRSYPYLYLRKSMPFPPTSTPYSRYTSEPVAGAVTNMPVVATGYLLVVTSVRRVARTFRRVLPTLAILLVPALLVLTVIAYTLNGATMRYELDFVPLIALGSTLGWAAWSRVTGRPAWLTFLGSGLWIVAATASVVFNLATTLTPCAGKGSC